MELCNSLHCGLGSVISGFAPAKSKSYLIFGSHRGHTAFEDGKATPPMHLDLDFRSCGETQPVSFGTQVSGSS